MVLLAQAIVWLAAAAIIIASWVLLRKRFVRWGYRLMAERWSRRSPLVTGLLGTSSIIAFTVTEALIVAIFAVCVGISGEPGALDEKPLGVALIWVGMLAVSGKTYGAYRGLRTTVRKLLRQ